MPTYGHRPPFKPNICTVLRTQQYLCWTWEWGVAWTGNLRKMESAWGRGVREARKISSQCSARAEATWRRKKRNGHVGRDEEGPARTE